MTVPVPVPDAPDVTDSQEAVAAAVHVHPDVVVTVNDVEPPAAPYDALAGDTA